MKIYRDGGGRVRDGGRYSGIDMYRNAVEWRMDKHSEQERDIQMSEG